jgi:DNA-binding transcriptional ArsR family regulator
MNKKKADTADSEYIEEKKVRSVMHKMKSERFFHYLAETFRAMSDPTRTKIIFALCQEKELCVSDYSFNYRNIKFSNITSA